jgi:hypothetical protein
MMHGDNDEIYALAIGKIKERLTMKTDSGIP